MAGIGVHTCASKFISNTCDVFTWAVIDSRMNTIYKSALSSIQIEVILHDFMNKVDELEISQENYQIALRRNGSNWLYFKSTNEFIDWNHKHKKMLDSDQLIKIEAEL